MPNEISTPTMELRVIRAARGLVMTTESGYQPVRPILAIEQKWLVEEIAVPLVRRTVREEWRVVEDSR